ncbi:monovalent cation:proton antiporter-2 (CPA2) family protein [Fluoribacter dumoffii]|uniref:monovalent cation:proton antiporter-2 (CPA2) family protein n=1 Tax=Fluoribacter dumoffii TaxID=463 RepID=UPI002243E8DF|nr:monovalent cation:proton antiporter-2 (CPA2) family protein [Fluoribacter dumoffii]MCW8418985.1 monovalent cation:proton antiporter-2 (CPA2) family protein [Fluoribacter dumoffii]MCW8453171.1 monovalent cation:proton antiporter-2 (CPA2) family protein [Fluoribacter dumoffii]MCW8459608.1 monovalent cation:proton antiporter-2 (CPA2) family protein [Fluoribacter dumoffii]MCW8482968.1 monovalent cation:proton antiporter-2 (CPA2) family protein [Fluoribacter dumoffii]
MNGHVMLNIFIFLASASIMVPIASRFKLGSVLGYLIVGILIGPFGLKLIGNSQQIMNFGEFGVIMMLFLIGLELEPSMLWKLRKLIIGLGGLQVLLTTCIFTAIGYMLGFSWQATLAVSMALSLSSTALVLQMLQEKNLLKTAEGETSFAVLLFQDIAVIPILIILPFLAQDGTTQVNVHEASFMMHLPRWLHALFVAGVVGAVILVGHYLSRHLFLIIAKTNLREVFTAFSLALVVGVTLLMESIGVSPALGAFIAGVVLANSQYKHAVDADIQPFKGILLGLFFISVGMGMNFSIFSNKATMIVIAVFSLIIIKALILYVLGLFFDLTRLQRMGFAFALAQGSEFAFVLFEYAGITKVISQESEAFFTLVVALSMLATPFLMLFYHRFVIPKFMSFIPEREYDSFDERNGIILAGYGRFGQIIGRLLNGENITVTVLEKNPEQIELLRKFGYVGYFGDASRLDMLKSAGAEHAKLLIVAVGNVEANLKIVKLAKQHFPHLKIFARARNRRHAYELYRLGVDYFIRELFDSSLSMTKEVMKFLGYNHEDIQKKTSAFRKHDETTLVQSFDFFEKESDLINFSRQAKGELERILQSS